MPEMTYLDYLKVPELLDLQRLQSDTQEHDEMLFIVIHQVYELWFKQILHELGLLRGLLERGETWTALKTLRRVLKIMKVLVHQVDVLETMTPLSFNQFRSFLQSASGFQSVQFRELEILCGSRSPKMTRVHPPDSPARKQLEARADEPTLWESFCAYLQAKGHDVPTPERKRARHGQIFEPSPETQDILAEIMRNHPDVELICEAFVDFDEGLQEWRYRHVKMVERTIGGQAGTGGSSGVEYLRSTLHRPVFPDLWAIRDRF